MASLVRALPLLVSLSGLLFVTGCASIRRASVASDHPLQEYEDQYDRLPTIGVNGIPMHLLRSHTLSILNRPASSLFSLSARAFDSVADLERRAEVRFLLFPDLEKNPEAPLAKDAPGMDLVEWESWLDDLTGEPSSRAKVKLIIGGAPFYDRFDQALSGAQERIDFQTYLFDNDDVAQEIADILRERSSAIDVRVMFDGLGTYLSHLVNADSHPPTFAPIKNLSKYLKRDSNIQVRELPNIWLSGSHVKSYIIDRRTAFIGGMNVGREYRHDWHDMMMELEGEIVEVLLNNFQRTWRYNGWAGDFGLIFPLSHVSGVYDDPGDVPVRLLYTRPQRAEIYRSQLEAIRRAQNRIYIENAYFSDDLILYELCHARQRGVDVRVIMPAKVNHEVMERSNMFAINTLLAYGAKVYAYPKMSHVKAAVYDGWACLGTANFDKLSLQINREQNLGTSHKATVDEIVNKLFLPDFEASTEVTEPVPLDFKDHLLELIADEA